MIGIIAKAATVAAGLGFGAGILAYRKGSKVKEDVEEKFRATTTEIINVRVKKGTDLSKVVVHAKVIVPEYVDEDGQILQDD